MLTRASAKYFDISKETAQVLMDCVELGARDARVGFEDCENTQGQVVGALNRCFRSRYPVRQDILESALWSCNLLSEIGKFKHPRGVAFPDFVKALLPPKYRYDFFFNLILEDKT
jgi:hypothetical protein